MIRLNDHEHDILSRLADREQMTISETVRWLVRREHERGVSLRADVVIEEGGSASGVRVRRAKA